jgi:SnoaL-like domain
MMNSRRTFIWKLGAGASAAVASTAGVSRSQPDTAGDPAQQAALLVEEQSLRRLHQAYEQAMDKGRYEQAVAMFADDAQVIFNGGIFSRRSDGVSRLYRDRFASGKSGRRMEPAPGFELAADQQRDRVEVSADRQSAKAVFPFSIQVGMPLQSENSLASMARLHGEGVQTWWEGGEYRVSYQKQTAGRWEISRLEYRTLSRADYRPGRSYAEPISVARFTTRFPQDEQGPDDLLS